jgi:hypothetical protein
MTTVPGVALDSEPRPAGEEGAAIAVEPMGAIGVTLAWAKTTGATPISVVGEIEGGSDCVVIEGLRSKDVNRARATYVPSLRRVFAASLQVPYLFDLKRFSSSGRHCPGSTRWTSFRDSLRNAERFFAGTSACVWANGCTRAAAVEDLDLQENAMPRGLHKEMRHP